MPPRTKKVATPTAPSTMKELKDTLWKAADKLRGSMDASQYKDVILGLVFLKYVSDSFDQRRDEIRAELLADGWDEDKVGGQLDDVDEYTGHNVFWVAPTARWSYLAQHAKGLPAQDGQPQKNIGQLVDEAMDLLVGANPSLKGSGAADLQPGQRRPASPRRARSTSSTARASPARERPEGP